jgi:hypothetical protein
LGRCTGRIVHAFDVREKAALCDWLNGIGVGEGPAPVGPAADNLQPAICHLQFTI